MESSRFILDSNIFFASYSMNDALHSRAILLMREIRDQQWLVPYSVVQEVTTLIAYRFGKKEADQFLIGLRGSGNILFISNDFDGEMNFYLQCDPKVSFVDAGLIHLSKKYNATLLTFDKQLLNLSKKHL